MLVIIPILSRLIKSILSTVQIVIIFWLFKQSKIPNRPFFWLHQLLLFLWLNPNTSTTIYLRRMTTLYSAIKRSQRPIWKLQSSRENFKSKLFIMTTHLANHLQLNLYLRIWSSMWPLILLQRNLFLRLILI